MFNPKINKCSSWKSANVHCENKLLFIHKKKKNVHQKNVDLKNKQKFILSIIKSLS